jgi:protein Mpv17
VNACNLTDIELTPKGWFATWQKAVAVFGPTQIINLTLVPPQHRLLLLQSVGLGMSPRHSSEHQTNVQGWNIFLSYQNNRNNKLLAAANDELLHAHTVQEEAAAIHKIEKLEKKRRDLREGEGGGAQGVATRMSWS